MRKRKKRRSLKRYVLLAGLSVGIGAIGYAYVASESLTPTPTRTIVYPIPYSDTRITENAKISDARFRDSVSLRDESGMASALSALRRWRSRPLPPPPADETPEKGTWLWTPVLQITPAYRNDIIRGAKADGITEMYLSIDSYLDIHALPHSEEKEALKSEFDQIVEDFIAHANREGIAVDAEGGWRNWAERGHEYKAKVVLEYAMEFNRTHDVKFRGFQYDVEPYLLEEYIGNEERVLRRFVSLIDESLEWMSGSDLKLSVVIPDFYDDSYGNTRKYFYGFRYRYTIDHLIGILERRPGSQIIVMAYRNYAEGTDGAIDIARDEIEAASGSNTKIVVAQETGDFPPPYITFYNTSRDRFESQLSAIDSAFAERKGYGGVALHYINSLMALR